MQIRGLNGCHKGHRITVALGTCQMLVFFSNSDFSHQCVSSMDVYCYLTELPLVLLRVILTDGPTTKIERNCSFSSVQFSRSVVSDSLRPHEPQHAGLPVYHQLPESTQTHVHRVGDAIQPSYALSSPSPPAPNPSQHQGLFQ